MPAENMEIPEEKPQKRKFEASILDHFNKLTHGQEKIRVKSGSELLKSLCRTHDKEEDELKYALGRLIRGLGASKVVTRTGYFSAFVALLNLKNVTVSQIFEHVEKELQKSGSSSKSEVADVSCGQILVGGAILRSDLYANLSSGEKQKVLEMMLKAGKERNYLNLAAYSFIIDLYKKIDAKEFKSVLLPLLKPEIGKPWAEQDFDTLYLLLETKDKFPEAVSSKFLKGSLESLDIVCAEKLPDLCSTLMTIPRATSLNHPVYITLVNHLVKEKAELLPQFFESLDEHLTRPNRNKYLAATQMLIAVWESLTPETSKLASEILATNYIQQTIAIFRTGKAKESQTVYKKLFETMLNALKLDPKSKSKLKVIKKLMFYPSGIFIFEKLTKSRVVQNITLLLDKSGIKKLAETYRQVVLNESEKNSGERWWNNDRIYASHLLVKLLNHPGMKDENEWKIEQIKFVMDLAFFDADVGGELSDAFRETFYSSLDLKLSKLEDLRVVLSALVLALNDGLDKLKEPLNEEEIEVWNKTLSLCKKLQGHKGRKQVFHTLFLHLGLQIFGTNAKLAVDSLRELFSCYERVKVSRKAESDDEDLQWIEVVVDLFLNLLSHSSHLLRNVIGCVFPHLCEHLNASGLHQILSVLDPKSDVNPLSHGDSDSEDEDDEDDDEDEDKDSEDSDEDEDSEEEEAMDDDDEPEDTITDKLRLALHEALGAGSDAESVDLDDMNDSDGERLDEALSAAFKQYRPLSGKNRKKQTKDDQTLTHFRVRVLDLIEIYLNSNPGLHLTLEIMLPLLQTLEFSIRDDHQRPLQDRCRACLKKLTSLKKFEDIEGVNEKTLVDLLTSLLDKGTKTAIIIQDMGGNIADCCMFVINCLQLVSKKHKKITEVIKTHLETFFKKRDCLTPYVLFKNVFQLNWVGITELVPLLMTFAFDQTVRPFRRSQALELLKTFYLNQRFIQSHQDEVSALPRDEFLTKILAFFQEFDPKKCREKYLCHLFSLLATMKGTDDIWTRIGEAIRECRSQISLSNDCKLAYNKLCGVLKISKVVKMKASVVKLGGDVPEDDDQDEKPVNGRDGDKKRKKQKNNKEGKKAKKECKELRLKSLSEGFESEKKKKRKMAEEMASSEEEEEKDAVEENRERKEKRKKKKRKTSE